MRVIIVLACLLAAVYARSMQMPEIHQWLQFKQKHGKTYENVEEEQHRIKVFLANKDFIDAHNRRFARGEVSHTVAINEFADLTNKEFVATYNNNFRPSTKKPSSSSSSNVYSTKVGAPLPASVDWRTKGAVTPVKNQGPSGSSGIFSAVGAIEGQHQIATQELVSLSEQQVIDCDPEHLSDENSSPFETFDYVASNHVIDTEDSYPYTGVRGPCKVKQGKVGATISSYTSLVDYFHEEDALTSAIANIGPISVRIDASHPSFQFYASGVYYEPECRIFDLDLALLVVGYDVDDNGNKYYIAKNSLGENWGNAGYINMARDRNNNCGIASAAAYPSV